MHPATHRALRELAADGRLLAHRWRRLADRLDDAHATPLRTGAEDADQLVDAFTRLGEQREIPLSGSATGLGATVGGSLAAMGEPFLERNQALRHAVLDAHRTTVLLHYIEHLARAQDDEELAQAAHDWAHRLVASEGAVRELAIAAGDDPESAVAPVDPSAVGQAAHQFAAAVGSVGEWVDRRMA
jgi:hypothetical protein